MIKNTSEPFSHLLSSDNISTIIESALTTGNISTDNLCLVMAYSGPSLYDDVLSWLLNKYDIEEPDLSTVEGRFSGWKTLFDTWCHGTYDGIHIKTPDGFPLQEAKNLFTRLDLKLPELLFPPQGMTPWLFPELNFEKLSDTALKWAKKYPFLKQIRLYKNPDQTGSDGRYLLIFETHDQAEYAGTYEGNVFNSRFSEMTVADSDFEKDLKEIYKEGHVPQSNLSTPWCPWIIQQEPAFDPEYPEPFNAESWLSEQSHHWVLFEPTKDGVMSEVNDIMAARSEGFVLIEDLAMFFSDEVSFTNKHLPSLWGKFDCEEIGGTIGPLSNRRWRNKKWMMFIYRIVFGLFIYSPKNCVSKTSKYRKLVQKYKYENGDYKPADLCYFEQNGYGDCFLNIEKVLEYLVNYAGLPSEDLPRLLFSSATSEPTTVPEQESLHIELPSTHANSTDASFGKKERKKTPDQLAKIKCREIAREAWQSDPLMTIADFALSNDISNACLEIACKEYSVETIRGWVKDLCLNREPGRRPGK